MQKAGCVKPVIGDICMMGHRELQICRKIILIPLVLGKGMGYNVGNPEKEIQLRRESI